MTGVWVFMEETPGGVIPGTGRWWGGEATRTQETQGA